MTKESTPTDERIKEGDKVGFSEYALSNWDKNQEYKEFMAKHAFEVVEVQVSAIQGVRYKLNVGTYLDKKDAKKLDKNTPLFH
jgi:hypothetical protein